MQNQWFSSFLSIWSVSGQQSENLQNFLCKIEYRWMQTGFIAAAIIFLFLGIMDTLAPSLNARGFLPFFYLTRALTAGIIIAVYFFLHSRLPTVSLLKISFLIVNIVLVISISVLSVIQGKNYFVGIMVLNMGLVLVKLAPGKTFLGYGALNILIYSGIYLFYNHYSLIHELLTEVFLMISGLVITVMVAQTRYSLIEKEFFQQQSLVEMHGNLLRNEEQIQKELEIAARIQLAMLPSPVVKWKNIVVSTCYYPMREVGGDFFDIIATDEGELVLLLADISGHGIPAALLTGAFKVSLNNALKKTRSPSEILAYLNEVLYGIAKTESFATAVVVVIDKKKNFSVATAGHYLPVLIDRKTGKVSELDISGPALGILPNSDFELKSATGSCRKIRQLILYTDGLMGDVFSFHEQKNSLMEFLAKNSAQGSEKIMLSVRQKIEKVRTGKKKQEDDISLLILEFN